MVFASQVGKVLFRQRRKSHICGGIAERSWEMENCIVLLLLLLLSEQII